MTQYAMIASSEQCNADLRHQRLGHLNEQQMKDTIQKELVSGVKMPKKMRLTFCQGCVEGKMHHMPFKPVGEIGVWSWCTVTCAA